MPDLDQETERQLNELKQHAEKAFSLSMLVSSVLGDNIKITERQLDELLVSLGKFIDLYDSQNSLATDLNNLYMRLSERGAH